MSAATALAKGRAAAERLMVDECAITRATGHALNEETGADESTYATVYTGKCRVQAGEVMAHNTDVAGREATFIRVSISVPLDADPALPGDLVTITAAAFDPQLPGRQFRVVGVLGKTHATARRLDVEEVL